MIKRPARKIESGVAGTRDDIVPKGRRAKKKKESRWTGGTKERLEEEKGYGGKGEWEKGSRRSACTGLPCGYRKPVGNATPVRKLAQECVIQRRYIFLFPV